jgi:Glyoxalase-like domain
MLQLTIDCADPKVLTRFWATALHYEIMPAPTGFGTWNDYYRSIGVPEDELDVDGDGADSIVDPDGRGPRIWFQIVPERKTVKNRLHIDLEVGGPRSLPLAQRRATIDAEVDRLIAAGATRTGPGPAAGVVDHYGVLMRDPEGNEFCVG